MRTTIETPIYFARLDLGHDEAGNPLPYDIKNTLARVNSLAFEDDFSETSRYWKDSAGKITACWVDADRTTSDGTVYHTARLGNVRRGGLPRGEDKGLLTPLQVKGLAEQVHIVFFPDGVVGFDFNFHGPRIERLAYYLAQKASFYCNEPRVIYLFRSNLLKRLSRLADIRYLDMKIKEDDVARFMTIDESLGSAFEAQAKTLRVTPEERMQLPKSQRYKKETISLVLSPKSLVLRRSFLGKVLSVFQQKGSMEMKKFHVAGYDRMSEKVEHINLLKDNLVSKKPILTIDVTSRALDPDDAYNAIIAAYNDLKDEISASVSIELEQPELA